MSNSHRQERVLSAAQRDALLKTLKARFEKHAKRHQALEWDTVRVRLAAAPEKLWSLHEMESSGGEPDVIGRDARTGELLFCDCAAETPAGRRSFCFDREALDSRKENKPANDAVSAAAAMGIDLLTEEQYRELQTLGNFDEKTSSWVQTPAEIRKLGGAIFCDRRYGRVFTYHNSASSYYAGRGFRGMLRV